MISLLTVSLLCLGCLLLGAGLGYLLAARRQEKPLAVELRSNPITLDVDGPTLRSVLNIDSYRSKRFS